MFIANAFARINKISRRSAWPVALFGSLALAGCGGGGNAVANSSGGGGSPGGAPASVPAVTFQVDVPSGRVKVIKSTATGITPKAVFAGDSITFNSSQLINLSDSEAGVRALKVSLTNNFGLPIGQDASGNVTPLRVIFGNFTDLSSVAALEALVNVSTLSGNGTAGSVNGPNSMAEFNRPQGVAATPSGAIYVTDDLNLNVSKIAGGVTAYVAGGAGSVVDGIGAAAGFGGPHGIAYNPVDGALYVADFGANKVRRLTPAGRVTTVAGTGASASTNGSGATATLWQPDGIAVDQQGAIYVTESAGNKVRKITLNGGADPTLPGSFTVTTLAGTGMAGTGNGFGANASFSSPGGIAVDGNGNVFVADTLNHKIRLVDANSGQTTTIAGNGSGGALDGLGNTATFNQPRGLAWMNGELLVSDFATSDMREMTLIDKASAGSSASWMVQTLANNGQGATDGLGTVAQFNGPSLIAVSGSNAVYIPDELNHKVRRLSGINGVFPVGTPGAGTTSTQAVTLSNATGIAASNVYGASVPYIDYAGGLESGATSSDQLWSFVVPVGVTSFQFTVMVESTTSALTPPTLNTSIVSTLAGTTNATGSSDGTLSAARFGLLKYGSMDAAGNLYVTDLSNQAVRRISPSGRVSTVVGGLGRVGTTTDGTGATAIVGSINAVAVSRDGTKLFFGDSNQIRLAYIFGSLDATDAGNWNVVTLAGTSAAGQASGNGTVASFNTIEDFALDPTGTNLYISCFFGNTIRKMTFKGGDFTAKTSYQVTTYAGDDSATNGASGNTNATGTSARFFNPRGIALDQAGNLYVADQSNFEIRMITPLQVVSTLAGSGTQGYGDGVGTAAGVMFSLVYGVAADSSGYVYVGDIGNVDIRRIAPDGTVTTVAGTAGTPGGVDGPGATATFVRPAGVVASPSGDVYVCDQSSIRVVKRLINTTGQ